MTDSTTQPANPQRRHATATPASAIPPKAVRWLWEHRIPVGELSLLAGREGIGKSTIAYDLAAKLTTGSLEGRYSGSPRAVVVLATEDSWEYTIVPRLIAAGADLNLVYRVDVTAASGAVGGSLTLPKDLAELESVVKHTAAVLVILDPLLSRLSPSLDTHRDGETRQGLEPLVALAKRNGFTVLGIIHVNKSASNDPLTTVMASRAFTAVARAVLVAAQEADDPPRYVLGFEKSNLGPRQVTAAYRIEGVSLGQDDEGEDIVTSRLEWLGDADTSVAELLQDRDRTPGAAAQARSWLRQYLTAQGGAAESNQVKDAAARAGHSAWALRQARQREGVVANDTRDYPRRTIWKLPGAPRDEPQPPSATPHEQPTGIAKLTPYGGQPECHDWGLARQTPSNPYADPLAG